MDQTIEDYDAIVAVVHLYGEGTARGDVKVLAEAFHDDARMFGHVEGHRLDVPIAEYFSLAEKWPADADDTYTVRVISVDQVGDVAVAVVVEEGVWGDVSFIDFFSLARIDDEWKIVSRAFSHTGGSMPTD
ncbi:MAG TPA: nuclear transport factor 2 family protein [Acidimicrobiales bacterium]|nr:nuclear transport factor 2 family protein [Acidimicrobiales bacterium]